LIHIKLFMRPSGDRAVTENTSRKTVTTICEIAEIEDAQAALRDSIEATKLLSERAETLLQKQKPRLEQRGPPRSC
jgi:hypothetical protein